MSIDISPLFDIDISPSVVGQLARLERRADFGFDDHATTVESLVSLIPDIVADAVTEAVEQTNDNVREWVVCKGTTIVDDHAQAFLNEGVHETCSALARRVEADLEDVQSGSMDALEALEGLQRLLSGLADSAKLYGKSPSEALEYELGAFYATADASEWSDHAGSFLSGTFADHALGIR